MGIGGVSDYRSLTGNYRIPEAVPEDAKQTRQAGPVTDAVQIKQPGTAADMAVQPARGQESRTVSRDIGRLDIEEMPSPGQRAVDVGNLSLTFNAGDDFGYIGRDSDLGSLDMQKAISEMKKDQVLQQYQYFVGNAENLLPKNAGRDGLVFLKF